MLWIELIPSLAKMQSMTGLLLMQRQLTSWLQQFVVELDVRYRTVFLFPSALESCDKLIELGFRLYEQTCI
jgi:hypothetical protein